MVIVLSYHALIEDRNSFIMLVVMNLNVLILLDVTATKVVPCVVLICNYIITCT